MHEVFSSYSYPEYQTRLRGILPNVNEGLENRATIFDVKYAKETQTYTEIMYFIGLNAPFRVKMVTGLGENFG